MKGYKIHVDMNNAIEIKSETTKGGLPFMTSAKFSYFLTTFPSCHCHKSDDFVPLVCFLRTPHPLWTSYMEAPTDGGLNQFLRMSENGRSLLIKYREDLRTEEDKQTQEVRALFDLLRCFVAVILGVC